MDVPLVDVADLEVRDGRLWHDGSPIDALYRRTDADRLDTPVGRFLQPVLARGRAEAGQLLRDRRRRRQARPRARARHHPLLPRRGAAPRPGRDVRPRSRETLERALDVFGELVVKDRASYGGKGVVVCPHADPADVEALREEVRAHPEDYVAQRLVELSTHPTEIDGGLSPGTSTCDPMW